MGEGGPWRCMAGIVLAWRGSERAPWIPMPDLDECADAAQADLSRPDGWEPVGDGQGDEDVGADLLPLDEEQVLRTIWTLDFPFELEHRGGGGGHRNSEC